MKDRVWLWDMTVTYIHIHTSTIYYYSHQNDPHDHRQEQLGVSRLVDDDEIQERMKRDVRRKKSLVKKE